MIQINRHPDFFFRMCLLKQDDEIYMTKSQQVFQDMIEYNKQLFDAFAIIHDKYNQKPELHQAEFNEKG